MRSSLLSFLLVMTLFHSGCGKNPFGGASAPALSDVKNDSVNFAAASYSGGVVSLTTQASSASSVGSYVGGGTGNKAMAGFDGLHLMAVSNLSSLSFEAKQNAGTYFIYFNLLVDLDCNLNEDLSSASTTIAAVRANRKILMADTFTTTALDNGYVRYTLNAADSNWLAAGGAGGLPAFSPGQPLSVFLASYPNACVINGVTADGGTGRAIGTGCQTGAALATSAPGYCGKSMNGLQILTGDSSNLAANDWSIRKITVSKTDGTSIIYK